MTTAKENAYSAIVVHGGAGGSRADEDGCITAAQAGEQILRQHGQALEAAMAAVTVLEDDGRFNAGSGSVLCLDGKTIEMDAAIMDSTGRLGAVACLQRVKNPVLVARAVADTPHWLLAGEGAERFARNAGFTDYYAPTERAKKRHASVLACLKSEVAALPGVKNDDFPRYWNYPAAWPGEAIRNIGPLPCDTVGAVVRDSAGHFAVAGSTGGSAPSLYGRVGDTPIVGSGFYAGPFGAVAATGIGEYIVRHLLAHTVYDWIANGMPLALALERGIKLFPEEIDVGLIAVSRSDAGARSNRSMPATVVEHV